MKKLIIYKRHVFMKSLSSFPSLKEVVQYLVFYGRLQFKNNHCEPLICPYVHVPFEPVLATRSKKALKDFIWSLNESSDDLWLRDVLESIYIGGLDR